MRNVSLEDSRHVGFGWMMPFKDTTIATLACSVLAITTATALLAFNHYADSTQMEAEKTMRFLAESRATEIEYFIRERLADAEIFGARLTDLRAQHTAAVAFLEPTSADATQQLLAQTLKSYGYRDIFIIDAKGHVARSALGASSNPLDKEVFSATLVTDQQQSTHLYQAVSGKTSLGVVHRLYAADSRPRQLDGTVYFEVDLNASLTPLIAEWRAASSNEENLLVRKSSAGLTYLTLGRRADVTSRQTRPGNYQTVASQIIKISATTQLNGLDDRGTAVIGAITPIRGTDWCLLVKTDRAIIDRPIAALRLAILSILGILVILLAVAAHLIRRSRQAASLPASAAAAARYRAAIEASMDGYFVASNRGVILEANDSLLQLLHVNRSDLIGRRIQDLQSQMTPDECDVALEKLIAAGNSRVRTRHLRSDGETVELKVSLAHIASPPEGQIHGFISDAGPELASQRRIERLSAFYLFTSHVNAAIFNLRKPQEILDAVCRAAVRDAGFVLAWAGFMEVSKDSLKPSIVYGDAADYARTLEITIDPVLPTSTGPTRQCMLEGRIICVNNFQSDPSTEPWHDKANRYGINSSAAIPILVNGEAIASLSFYSREIDYFDIELEALLEETAHNISLALQSATAERERLVAEAGRHDSEERFSRIFESSPFPMEIWTLPDRKLLAMNRAHERAYGYTREEIADPSTWNTTTAPDPEYRSELLRLFDNDIERAVAGGPSAVIESPEISIHCKSGENRFVRGYMSVSGADLIIQWLDVTDIKRQQADLVEGERRFRGMIEQTLSGVYVTANECIVYVNPQLESILGLPRTELLGATRLTLGDVAEKSDAEKIREKLHAASKDPDSTLFVSRPDGARVVINMHATSGTWDGAAAQIVMAQDITEKSRTEEKIKSYVRQLEGTMRGTLQAVANMIELRDPYTSGHERRVGIIASDIARELGWTASASDGLQLIGLVHDIGKIGIPAEILAKPTQLTALEYSMIKTHAEKGFEILKDIDFPIPIAEIILQHHERMDGSGYPRGLKGEEIRLEARIIAVADTLEAMASHRPYRASLGVSAALRELESNRGTLFDAAVVDATLRLVREKGYQLPL